MNENMPSKWICQFCKKLYSHNYPYNEHLKRCIIHVQEREDKNDITNTLMEALKIELKNDINNMLIELKNDIMPLINNNNNPTQKKNLVPFNFI